MKSIVVIIAKNIKILRVGLEMTQEQFAEFIEVQPRTIANLESGKHMPHHLTLDKIKDKLCINPSILLDNHFAPVKGSSSRDGNILMIKSYLQKLKDKQLDDVHKYIANVVLDEKQKP